MAPVPAAAGGSIIIAAESRNTAKSCDLWELISRRDKARRYFLWRTTGEILSVYYGRIAKICWYAVIPCDLDKFCIFFVLFWSGDAAYRFAEAARSVAWPPGTAKLTNSTSLNYTKFTLSVYDTSIDRMTVHPLAAGPDPSARSVDRLI